MSYEAFCVRGCGTTMRRNTFRFTHLTPLLTHSHRTPHILYRTGYRLPLYFVLRALYSAVHVYTYTIVHRSPSPGLTREGLVPERDREDLTPSTLVGYTALHVYSTRTPYACVPVHVHGTSLTLPAANRSGTRDEKKTKGATTPGHAGR